MASLGNLVRLLPLHMNELPAHPTLESLIGPDTSTTVKCPERPDVTFFVKEVLEQATTFVNKTLPETFKEGNLKTSLPSKAQVRLLSREFGSSDIESVAWTSSTIPRKWSTIGRKPSEAWFARRSLHANQQVEGTANLEEFDYGLRYDHSKHEQEYTPDVFDSYKVLDWQEQIKETLKDGSVIDDYRHLTMSVYEMCHQFPAMLSNRTFSVLVVTARRGENSFIIVQIPVDITNLNSSFYSNGRNLKEGDSSLKRKKSVQGIYTSIETCQLLPDGQIEWVMATASDAGGWLPMWGQKLGVPPAVAKDVGLFMKWIRERRSST